jgi:hypothetical protein
MPRRGEYPDSHSPLSNSSLLEGDWRAPAKTQLPNSTARSPSSETPRKRAL